MDLRAYYKKLREVERQMDGGDVVIVSLATDEGGKDGVRTEAPREVAARQVAEGRARVATAEEAEAFHQSRRAAREKIDQDETARRIQVMVVPSSELRKPRERS
jgi:hypothetical protein